MAEPAQKCRLAFDAEGIIGSSSIQLGTQVVAFDFADFYADLGQSAAGSPAQLQYDSGSILAATPVAASTLLSLRAEGIKAALDKAIGARANAYYAKYGNQAAIIAWIRQYYAPINQGSKPQLLSDLATLAQQQADLLQESYTADDRLGVVRSTASYLNAKTQSSGKSVTNTTGTQASVTWGSAIENSAVEQQEVAGPLETGSGFNIFGTMGTEMAETGFNETTTNQTQDVKGKSTSEQAADGYSAEEQSITNTGYDYRVPSIENMARNARAQISLIDERYAQFMAGQNLPYLESVMSNELDIIDLDIRRRQISYLNTILLSPIDGIVTRIAVAVGDYAKRGEAVVEVVNNKAVLLRGTLVYRGLISPGDSITVRTARFGNPLMAVTVAGTVVLAVGDESADDWWNIVMECDNTDGDGKTIFPQNYYFDPTDTVITIT